VASGEAPADFSAEEIGASAERLAQLTGIGVVIGIVLLVGVGAQLAPDAADPSHVAEVPAGVGHANSLRVSDRLSAAQPAERVAGEHSGSEPRLVRDVVQEAIGEALLEELDPRRVPMLPDLLGPGDLIDVGDQDDVIATSLDQAP